MRSAPFECRLYDDAVVSTADAELRFRSSVLQLTASSPTTQTYAGAEDARYAW
jgi:hypothetical protein